MLENNHTITITLNEYLYEMLEKIKQRPGMFLGKSSITRLRAFLDGYMSSREDLGLPPTQQEIEFNQFPDWIQTRFKITSAQGWDSIILFYSTDERDALNNFFELFEQFRNGESARREAINQEQVIESQHSLIPQ
ncbi:hypothetical protein NIES37_03820 [Tolypothrix tenuis PCC 7101]|uniref:Uncharacterized protein n=1 Tax=Tolypothrix tenuis PCC 7101 TaxID=231146 RepID=A0A1Z4MSM7_9CYAN|nr:hypothetical protein [Aulosira sp. FACHB-113]BAY96449.1 hypothetical protein NIES37_03820 [Tolypothrix tenuis PCC 7101]BAZ73043.1 hypothetical protein NIES50_16010 [Aulosira laxa NIES-50]